MKASAHIVHHADFSHAYVLENGGVILTTRTGAPHRYFATEKDAIDVVGKLHRYSDRKNRPRDDGWTGDVEFSEDRLALIKARSDAHYCTDELDVDDDDGETTATKRTRRATAKKRQR